jgi:hypothetical protein
MDRSLLIFALASILLLATGTAPALADGQGPQNIEIFGGSRGKVPFPHAAHQARLKDCNVCHDAFPQQTDAIKTLKTQGALKPKKVMNVQCIKCHRADKRAGKPHGPLTCATCHIK